MAIVFLLVLYGVSALALAYVYAGYPTLLALAVRLVGPREVRRDEQIRPGVTLIISYLRSFSGAFIRVSLRNV